MRCLYEARKEISRHCTLYNVSVSKLVCASTTLAGRVQAIYRFAFQETSFRCKAMFRLPDHLVKKLFTTLQPAMRSLHWRAQHLDVLDTYCLCNSYRSIQQSLNVMQLNLKIEHAPWKHRMHHLREPTNKCDVQQIRNTCEQH